MLNADHVRFIPRRTWSTYHFVQLGVLISIGIWLNRQPLADIIAIGWNDPEQSHIFLAPLVAGYLAWLRRSRLRNIPVGIVDRVCRLAGELVGI
jgi:hypothetical protein